MNLGISFVFHWPDQHILDAFGLGAPYHLELQLFPKQLITAYDYLSSYRGLYNSHIGWPPLA